MLHATNTVWCNGGDNDGGGNGGGGDSSQCANGDRGKVRAPAVRAAVDW